MAFARPFFFEKNENNCNEWDTSDQNNFNNA